MSLFSASSNFSRSDAPALRLYRQSESSDDDDKRVKRREKNRVAAQRSRKRQTQRADELHEAYECLEQENSLLREEVQLLIEEQQRLTDALKAHEPLCRILTCGMTPITRSTGTVPPEFTSR
ncbi:basic leucine zipper transcriptional factor ATF-like 3 [Danio rerio]|uniref:Basic leucine zipper transcriptional factor ATF-like 3 n=1 Tax=Danio rerio TaxID=7955 RepID=Q0P430_DANRE|nr:basic leucine zipper transcriptional factor ATF-like 3 [Danio rerio]AAI22304.1 Si:ch211-147d7.2 [Danio rerio]AAI64923.1 Si:ch211-147d7.2 [Danio rerio]|eukprot:NP_001038857.1 basic leucine zipper transcriptional factor ATF-like 3 [Danio rerio]